MEPNPPPLSKKQAREIIDGDYLRQREQEETGVTAAESLVEVEDFRV